MGEFRFSSRDSHVRMEAKRQALDALSRRGERHCYDTKSGTKDDSGITFAGEVIEEMVGTRRLELLTFPASRDALTNDVVNQFPDRAV